MRLKVKAQRGPEVSRALSESGVKAPGPSGVRASGARPQRSLEGKALQWLAQREHSRQELRAKLLRWQILQWQREDERVGDGAVSSAAQTPTDQTIPAPSPARQDDGRESRRERQRRLAEEVDAVLDRLAAQRHLSDERFVESRIHVRQARFGNRRIEQELGQHGLSLSADTRTALRQSEVERARAVLASRFRATDASIPADSPDVSARELQRRQRFLAARGFSAESIRAALRAPDDD